jgi:sorting nexin-8
VHIPTLRLRNTEFIRGTYVDVSIEQVAALSSQNTLPEPTLDLDRLQPSTSSFAPTPYRQNTAQTIRPAGPAYSDDPWSTNKYLALPGPANPSFGSGTGFNPAPPAPPPISAVSSVQGTGLPDFWWKRQENVRVTLLGQQGFILNRYVVYEIATEVSASILFFFSFRGRQRIVG